MGKFPLLATNFSQNQNKVARKTLHLYAVLCFKNYARTSVSCNVNKKVEQFSIYKL